MTRFDIHRASRFIWRRKALLSCVALLLIGACQFTIKDFEQEDQVGFVRIDAEVTPDYASANVSYTSSSLVGTPGAEPRVPLSELYLIDGDGNRTDLPMDGSRNTAFRGAVRQSYTLYVVAADGKKYQSLPETIGPVPPIDTVVYKFSTDPDLNEKNLYKHGFDVTVLARDLPETGNFYTWNWVNYAKRYRCGEKTVRRTRYNVQCSEDCWSIIFSKNVELFSDAAINGGKLSYPLVRVPFVTPPKKYYLMVEQRAIPERVYQYLSSIREQTQSNGNQFDVPAQTQFSTNIFCQSDPKEKVLGVLNTFSYVKKLIYIDRSITIPGVEPKIDPESLLETYPCTPFFPGPCKLPCEEGPATTKIAPEGWIE